jgi:hypothetical protein
LRLKLFVCVGEQALLLTLGEPRMKGVWELHCYTALSPPLQNLEIIWQEILAIRGEQLCSLFVVAEGKKRWRSDPQHLLCCSAGCIPNSL